MALADNLADLARTFLGDPDNQDIGRPGYVVFPNGLILQWGLATGHGTPGNLVTVNYPLEFPNQCFQVIVGGVNSTPTGGKCWCSFSSKASFSYYSDTASFGGAWIAIGY